MPRRPASWISDAGSDPLLLPGDLRSEQHCKDLVAHTEQAFGGLDLLVLNAAHQRNRGGIDEIPTDDFEHVVRVNLFAPVFLARAAVPLMEAGSSIITTTSIQGFDPSNELVDYAMTKAALVAFTKALAEELGPRGIRVNAVAPGPIWTPLIPSTGWPDHLPEFGRNTPLGRAGPAGRARGRLRVPRVGRGVVRLGRGAAGHRRARTLTLQHERKRGAHHAGTQERLAEGPRALRGAARRRARRRRRPPASRTRRRPRVAARSAARAASTATTRTGRSTQLRKRAKELGLTGYSGKRKAELISALRNH